MPHGRWFCVACRPRRWAAATFSQKWGVWGTLLWGTYGRTGIRRRLWRSIFGSQKNMACKSLVRQLHLCTSRHRECFERLLFLKLRDRHEHKFVSPGHPREHPTVRTFETWELLACSRKRAQRAPPYHFSSFSFLAVYRSTSGPKNSIRHCFLRKLVFIQARRD